MFPKCSAEILAAAKLAPLKQIRKAKVNRNLPFSQYLSIIPNTLSALEELTASVLTPFQSGQSQDVHQIIQFNDPVTPQSLESAFEIDSDIDRCLEDLFDDNSVLVPTWVELLAVLYAIKYISFTSPI